MDRSRLFTPPMDKTPPDNDPMIIRVPMNTTDWAARASQQKAWDTGSGSKTLKNLPNGN